MSVKHMPPEASIFDSRADYLVCPVNCVGAMGKGLALEFKKRFPDCEHPYLRWVKYGMAAPGKVRFISKIAVLATKDHWRDPSRMEWIDSGLRHLESGLRRVWLDARMAFPRDCDEAPSVAIPALGCGLGGLPWDDVRDRVVEVFLRSKVAAELYPPRS